MATPVSGFTVQATLYATDVIQVHGLSYPVAAKVAVQLVHNPNLQKTKIQKFKEIGVLDDWWVG